MKTRDEMYNSAVAERLAGIPYLAYPLPFFAKMSFGVVEGMLLDNEEAIFTFMMVANPADFDNRGSNGMNQNSFSQGGNQHGNQDQVKKKIIRQWIAFALTDRGHLYYGIWKGPFMKDNGDVPIISENDINMNMNSSIIPYHSQLDIDTLRKSLPNLNQTSRNVSYIRSKIYSTIQALSSHKDTEGGRRVYDQSMSTFDDDQRTDDHP